MNHRSLRHNERLRMEYEPGKGEPIVIEENGIVIGYVWFKVLTEEGINVLYIDMIETIVKGKGEGKRIVEYLVGLYNVDKIEGYVVLSPWNGAYSFWKKLGAIFSEDEEIIKSLDYGDEVDFYLQIG